MLQKHYSVITPGYAMKMEHIQPERGRFNFHDADYILDYAIEHNLLVRGHTLVWHEQIPDWVSKSSHSGDELRTVMEDHISSVVSHFRKKYPGRVKYWDVVNEAFLKNGEPRKSLWTKIGNGNLDYLSVALLAAKRADPSAKLFYNDFGTEWNPKKAKAVYQLVRDLQNKDIPIDGVGFQLHLETEPFDPDELKRQFSLFHQLGLEVHITEMDSRIKVDDGLSENELNGQLESYRNALRVCLESEACKVFATWGFTDRYSWIPSEFPGYGSALPFDENYGAKPVFWTIVDVLRQN